MKSIFLAAVTASVLLAPVPGWAQSAITEDKFVAVQPADQWRASLFIGQAVTNAAGETVGNINDLLFDKSGRIANVVVGVGGMLGIGEKDVAIPYDALAITADGDGRRVIKVALSRERLEAAPAFNATEKSVYMRAKEQASEMGRKALDKANELTDQAGKKLEDMRK